MAAALLLLIGGSIALAGQALDSNRGVDRPAPSAPPPPAPALLAPDFTVTRQQSIDLTGLRPNGLRVDQQYRLRVFVNGELVYERPLPGGEQFVIAGIPLAQDGNEIRAALVGAGGEGPRSGPVSVVRDDVAPIIRVVRPQPAATIYTAEETLRGRTEAGADMKVVEELTGLELQTSVQPDGRFEAALSLALGENPLLLRSQDKAGNVSRTRIVLVRAESAAALSLVISPAEVGLADLPMAIEMVVTVHDELGRPVDGAQVIFGLSPPNRPTMTYRTTSADGLASWPELEVGASSDAAGTWLVTVLAVLPSGTELREDKSFTVR